jgi:hypothetical protein
LHALLRNHNQQEITMPQDRTLNVDVYVIGQQDAKGDFGAQVAYIQTNSNPFVPNMVNFRTGDLNFTAIGSNPNFTRNIDITFTLKPFMFDQSGNPVQAVWATPLDKAVSLTGPNGPVKSIVPSYVNQMKLLLDSQNKASMVYTYKLGFMLPAYGNYFISLDPRIENSGPTTPEPLPLAPMPEVVGETQKPKGAKMKK